jgi:uncharacterized membrane protein AbrB (regulator of aidB expression)
LRWFKVAAIVVGVMIAFLLVSSVVGFLVEAVIAVLAVAVIVLGVKGVPVVLAEKTTDIADLQ